MRRILIAIALLVAPFSAQAQDEATGPICHTVRDCVEIIRSYQIVSPPARGAHLSSGIDPRPIQRAIDHLRTLGDEAVIALLPLLGDQNYNVRNRASYTLFHFPTIDARHDDALMAAHHEGLGWLILPIARTGTDEALDYLWADFLADPNFSSNSQQFHSLPRFGERLYPRLSEALTQCRTEQPHEPCAGIVLLLGQYDQFPAFALPLLQDIAISPTASREARDAALDQLIRQRHPYGLTSVQQALWAHVADLPPLPQGPSMTTVENGGLDDLGIAISIGQAGSYGADGVAAGGPIGRFLGRRDLPEARQAAALALGKVGYLGGIETLLAQAPDFTDDWYLAYNATESLGRLRANAARPLLERLAHEHWYQPVRNNASRALNMLDGGAFERPGIEIDTAEPDDPFAGIGSPFRYQGDTRPPGSCLISNTEPYVQYLQSELRWPRRGRSVELELRPPAVAQRRGFLRRWPAFEPDGEITFILSLARTWIVGTDMGEWGGGVWEIDRNGEPRQLIDDNALAAFRSDSRLFVLTGLSHLSMSNGNLWIIDTRHGRAHVRRRIALPSESRSVEAAFPETLVISTDRGALAVRSDGALIHPEELEACE